MPSVKFSEHSDRPEFIDLLKRGLGIKFKVYQEVIYIDANGTKQQTDIVIFDAEKVNIIGDSLKWTSDDSVIAIIETKIKHTRIDTGIQREERLDINEPQLLEYLKSLKCKIGFLTDYNRIISYNYTNNLDKPEKKPYYSERLDEVADFIIEGIRNSVNIPIQKTPARAGVALSLKGSNPFLCATPSPARYPYW